MKMKYSKAWLTKRELKKLFSYPKISFRDLLLMKVTYYGALRIGETLKSKKEDYQQDPRSQILLREQKTDKKNWEVQPIPPEVLRDVMIYCKSNKIGDIDYVFQSNRGVKMSYNNAYKLIKKWGKKVGINKPITTHSFRRSRASHLLEYKKFDIYKVADFLRHSRIETTQKYLKISKKNLHNLMMEADEEDKLMEVI
jgi:integrase/recombinase XerD